VLLAKLKQREIVLEIVVRAKDPGARSACAHRALVRLKCDVGALAKHDFDDELRSTLRFLITCPRKAMARALGRFAKTEIVSCAMWQRPAEVAPALERMIPFWGPEKTSRLRELYPHAIPLPHKKWDPKGDVEELRTRHAPTFTQSGKLRGLGGISGGRKLLARMKRRVEDAKTCEKCAVANAIDAREKVASLAGRERIPIKPPVAGPGKSGMVDWNEVAHERTRTKGVRRRARG
jgi:hypothetical protein